MAYFASQSQRKLYLFDTFSGFDSSDIKGIDKDKTAGHFSDTSLNMAKDVIGNYNETCFFIKGHFPNSISEFHRSRQYAVVHLDLDLYEPMKAGLNFFYSRMPKGGLFLLHDYSSMCWEGAKKAIDEFCMEQNQYIILMPDKSGSAFIRKSN